MSSQREIRLNAFDMNCVGHQSPGLWAHPRDRSWQYKDLEYWVDLARLLERGKFDGLFIADVLGIYDVLNGSGDAAIRQATQVPVNDPLALITPMALVTEHLGFGLTASLSFEHPYPFARRLSTLDHLTKGRVGWNIVTSYLESGARNIGQQTQTDHDTRYDYADEYLQVIYKLLEGSWEDGAVLRDRERKIFSDPRKIHPINHQGQFFSVPGIHLCEPSPQRTPVLYQAGASSRGKQFAAGHAECVFVAAPSKVLLKKTVADIRRRAAEAGRDPHSILIFNLQTVIVGDTDREAQAKWQEYKQYVSYEGALALLSGWTGIDFGQYQPDQVLKYLHTNAIQSAVEAFSTADPNRQWTVQALADWAGIGGFGPLVVGSAQTVADELQSWVEETDVDGFNLAYAVTHETFRDVVELLVPELQKRGVFKQEYREGTLREKLFGGGPRLAAPHPGASYRRDAHGGIGRGEGDMIAIDDLYKSYRTADGRLSAVLKGLSLQVPERSITAVVGPSGAGKSTLARCISLLEQPDSGSIRINGQDLSALSGEALRRERRAIGTVFQSSALLSRRTAWENVALPLAWLGVVERDIKARVGELLESVGLSHKADAWPAQLSGGQRQRIGIARALALRPSVLLADEATSGLDPQATASVLALLKRLRDEYQLAIVLITHEMDAVRTAADAVAEIRDGTIVQYGRIEDLLARPDSLLGQQLLPLTPAAATHSDLLLRLSYRWDVPVATDWISRLSQQWALQIDLLGGHVEVINGRLAGRLQAGVRFQGERLSPARLQGLLAQLGITAEILDSAPLLREAV